MSDVVRTTQHDHVTMVEMNRPPSNFFDRDLLEELAATLLELDTDPEVRAIVLCSNGKHFCAGADLRGMDGHGIRAVYRAAARLFSSRKPIVAAIQGAAVGGGLGLAMAADFRVAAADARLTANFARIGFHQGFGLSATLPRVVGMQRTQKLLYTGRNVSGTEAAAIGLCDQVTEADPRDEALILAREIAESAPLALTSIRSTLRRDLAGQVAVALDLEATAQESLLHSEDFAEGVNASIERRAANFRGR